ncbi:hypothetical protein N7520_002842 [Penicillium odoratum]|uniref:uncharacterized protein n=1 Tax=Penicillium odoratum TaxID=1167516 RepID=UPI0025495FCF|nr:uncharacterized protein N7520_002842 [Penicillium odoratum]KAJ5772313.1 hypothetical protein N7520_002842 [Penicillium odoratum]
MQLEAIPLFTENMKRRLARKPELLDELVPDFPPTCRRLTPGPGYLEALTDPQVELIKSTIVKVEETGIITADGSHRPVDMIVCATGFDTSYTPRFSITGRGGIALAERWKVTPETYLSIATDEFPNYFICFGPNSGLGEGNVIMLFEKQIEYFAECLRKIQRDNIRSMIVRADAVRRFTRYCDDYFKGTVYASKRRSWYKGGSEQGRVTGVWPGSSIHAMKVFSNPHLEDFEYEYLNNNPWGWIGDGWTENEKHKRINVDYLNEDQIDFPHSIIIQNGAAMDNLEQIPPQIRSSSLHYYPRSPPRWTAMKPAEKHFRCTICQRGFTRIDHLKRHHLRHSGQKPYSCVFCSDSFARWYVRENFQVPDVLLTSYTSSDNLRDHYAECAQRGDRQIPETGQRGRRRHACLSCTSMKLRCDGQSPCGSCVKRNLDCNNERTGRPQHVGLDEGSPATGTETETYAKESDRGSIKFLLNSGLDSFTEDFRLPPRNDRARTLIYNDQEMQEASVGVFPYDVQGNRPGYTPGLADPDPAGMQYFPNSFLDFFNASFGDQKPIEDLYTGHITYPAGIPPVQDLHQAIRPDQAIFEPERPFAMALVQSILARAWTVPLDNKGQEEISSNLNFLLTTARIRKFASLYFKFWQPSCPMIHVPSFDPETVSLPLLAAVVFMGAMYSSDQKEVYIAKRVFDFAEIFVYSSQVYSAETEIASLLLGNRNTIDEADDWTKFQNFQAGFIMVAAQYWAGNQTARGRAMENRFSEVVKLARRLRLIKCRHMPHEQSDETLWIQTECRIRTISIISLMDCAFFFFQNYPYRLSTAEMENDFPCEQSLFQSKHPFSEPNFRLSRNLTLYEAFQNLFACPQGFPGQTPDPSPMDLTLFDMFILIHILFAFINTHMMLVGTLGRHSEVIQLQQKSSNGKSAIPEDSLLSSIMTALNRWHDHWLQLRTQVPNDEWTSMGFLKNGYNFWLVSQLLVTKKDAVEVLMRMEVNCDDKLEKLKVLLQDDQE